MEAIFFDIDETLLSEMPLVMLFLPQVYEMLSKKLGISRGDARLKFLRELSERRNTYEWHDWNFFFESFGLNFKYEELLRAYPHKIRVFPDVKPTLEWLKEEGYKLGVITSGPEYQKLKLRITKLDKYFDVVVTRDDVKTVKPDPKIFLYACEKLNVDPQDAMMIGDNLYQDVYGAKNVGMLAVWINRDESEDYNFADFEIRGLYQLRKILGGLR
ncbi:TIGR02253 family HAD-type hydrolase [Thermococcus aggregans]|uniref:Glyceraldehyde 3-phosphate phosphatase n=1 Tax=Thermococcus aggregans TaxID=110163 RepID=A0A9E7MXS3_THEAG|nr:TIGR02253 family HAD-type hydrolase [Thermococcus aggregans]USS40759.1 TIGR02253 family HAD-type hydrolase [Thermococcus aggregans]